MQLRIPGPTPCPKEVLEAVGKPMINHRGTEFLPIISRLVQNLQKVFQTGNDVLLLSSSGTGGLEAAVASFIYPGDQVLATTIGYFGDRWAEIARRQGARVTLLEKPWGESISPVDLDEALYKNPGIKAVLITHTETSTGVTNDIKELARVAKKYNVRVFVDAVSSLGTTELETDEWGLDVVVSASQKGLMAPPGLALVSVSESAWCMYRKEYVRSFYFDLGMTKKHFDEKKQTPSTPALSICFGLDVALEMILEERLENVFYRHRSLAMGLRSRAANAGWQLFPDARIASDAVTALKVPDGVDGHGVVKRLKEEYGIEVGGGLGNFSGKIIRIGHMGNVHRTDIDKIVFALRAIR